MSTPPRTLLTRQGYGIRKDKLTTKELRKIRKELTVRPFVPPGTPIKPDAFPIYSESLHRIWVPREWGRKEFGPAEKIKITEGIDCSKGLRFKGSLRPHQTELLKGWLTNVIPSSTPQGRILTVPCGYGKTVMSLWCASQVGRKTMIIVHKEFLMNQFRDEIKRFMPDASIGRLQGNTVDIEGHDIILVMLQSLVSRRYPAETFEGIGMVIFDECHHLAAEVFSRALSMLGFWRMLGLSATPTRKDNLSKIFHWHIGEFLAKIEMRKAETVQVYTVRHKVSPKETEYLEEPRTQTDHVSLPRLITRVSERDDRSSMIAHIAGTLAMTDDRRVLILADRKLLLGWLYKYITSESFHGGIFKDDVGYYIGGMKPDALEESATKRIIIGTFAMASEGMNIPSLDTLILATPKSDIVQSVGRILRKKLEDRHVVPLVVDILDPHASLQRQYQKRRRTYNKYNYDVRDVKWDSGSCKLSISAKCSKVRARKQDNTCHLVD